MIVDLPEIVDLLDVCEACLMGRQDLQSFPKEVSRAKAPLGLVHTDLYGKMEIATLRGSFYFMMIIDDYSRRIWIYFLKTQD